LASKKEQKKAIKEALQDSNLLKAMERASARHFEKFCTTTKNIAWSELKDQAQVIREECLPRLPQLIEQFKMEAEKSGAYVYEASTSEEALSQIEKIVSKKKAKLIVKAKSMVSEEIGLNSFLENKGYNVLETDLGEWIIQLAKERPSHITAPALHKTKEEIASLLSQHLQRDVPPDAKKITKIAREEMRKAFFEADIGFSGANLAIAESGTLLLVSNEGNARLVTSLPPVHIAILTTEKFVETLDQATTLLKALVTSSSGLKLTSYVSLITGPSKTTDIEKELVVGVHGPQEVHIIILDNGRLAISRDKNLKNMLYCLKCGGCMLVCPIFQSVGGHIFGGPVYPGGIGILLTAATQSLKDSFPLLDFCSDCKKCEEFCPVGVPTGELHLHLRSQKNPTFLEKNISKLFKNKSLFNSSARLLSILQKIWQKGNHIKPLPFPWTKGKSLPAIRIKKSPFSQTKKNPRVFLFEGCLTKLFFPEIRSAVFSSLSRLGYSVVSPSEQVCCGAPSLHLGQKKDIIELAKKNIKTFQKENPDFILTVCPTGHSILKKVYPQLLPHSSQWSDKIWDFTAFMAEKRHITKLKKKGESRDVFYHYPCHYVNDLKLHNEPKEVLTALNFSVSEEKEPLTCCGFCGVFSIKNPEISDHLWKKKMQKLLKSSSPLIATDCPGCLLQLRSNLKTKANSKKAYHTAEIIESAFDPTRDEEPVNSSQS
jgi:iron-sulfur cluster protein